MEKFYLEKPTFNRKNDALEYIHEFFETNSGIHGVGSLNKYIDDYGGWLRFIEENWNRQVTDTWVPSHTYFLIRKNDDRIVGMIDIRLALTEFLKKYGFNIGYSIRPSERGKGYNKINLYLGLQVCADYGLKEVYLDADLDNPASWKTMEALGGKRIKEHIDEEDPTNVMVDYVIDVEKSLEEYRSEFAPYIDESEKVR